MSLLAICGTACALSLASFLAPPNPSAARQAPPTTIAASSIDHSNPAAVSTVASPGSRPDATARRALLASLDVSFAALEAYDGYATSVGVRRGAVEANPLMRGLAGHPAAFWAVKGTTTVFSIYLAERLWRQHRRGQAIALMLASNGLMAAVAARNSVALHTRR